MSINFDSTLNAIDTKIQESIQVHLDSLKKSLLSEAKDVFVNDFTKKINGDNELFTPNYNKDFLDKYINFNTSIPSGNTRINIDFTAHGIKSYINPNEYVVFIKPEFSKNIGQGYYKPPKAQFNFIIVTNMLNIHTIINNKNVTQINNLLLNDLQIDLFNKLCYRNMYKHFSKNNFTSKYEAIKKDYENLESKYNGEIYKLKQSNIDQKIIDTIKDNVNKNNFHYLKNYKHSNSELYKIVIEMKNHEWNRVSEHYKYYNDNLISIKQERENIERTDKQIKQYETARTDLEKDINRPDRANLIKNNKHQINRLREAKKNHILCINNKSHPKLESSEILINHLVYMFKTFWNGKTLSPYAKELKAENEKLKARENEIKLRSKELERLENEQFKKINITKLLQDNAKSMKELDKKHTQIKADTLKNEELIKQLTYLKEKEEYLENKEKNLDKKAAELDLKKIKLAQYKKSLEVKTQLLSQQKEEFELEKQNLLNMDMDLSDDDTEPIQINSENIKLEIKGRIKKGGGYKDSASSSNRSNFIRNGIIKKTRY